MNIIIIYLDILINHDILVVGKMLLLINCVVLVVNLDNLFKIVPYGAIFYMLCYNFYKE